MNGPSEYMMKWLGISPLPFPRSITASLRWPLHGDYTQCGGWQAWGVRRLRELFLQVKGWNAWERGPFWGLQWFFKIRKGLVCLIIFTPVVIWSTLCTYFHSLNVFPKSLSSQFLWQQRVNIMGDIVHAETITIIPFHLRSIQNLGGGKLRDP